MQTKDESILKKALKDLLSDLEPIINGLPNASDLTKNANSEYDVNTYHLKDTEASTQNFLDPTVCLNPANAEAAIQSGMFVDANKADYAQNSILALWNIAQRTLTMSTSSIFTRIPKLTDDKNFIETNFNYLDTKTWVPQIVNRDTFAMAQALAKFVQRLIDGGNQTFGFIPDSPQMMQTFKANALKSLQTMLKLLKDRLERYEAMTPERQEYLRSVEKTAKYLTDSAKDVVRPYLDFDRSINRLSSNIRNLTQLVSATVRENVEKYPALQETIDNLRSEANALNQKESPLTKLDKLSNEVKEVDLPAHVYVYLPRRDNQEGLEKSMLRENVMNIAIDSVNVKGDVERNITKGQQIIHEFSYEQQQAELQKLTDQLDDQLALLKLVAPVEKYLDNSYQYGLTKLNEHDTSLEGRLILDENGYPESINFPKELIAEEVSEAGLTVYLKELTDIQDQIKAAEHFYGIIREESNESSRRLKVEITNLANSKLPEAIEMTSEDQEKASPLMMQMFKRQNRNLALGLGRLDNLETHLAKLQTPLKNKIANTTAQLQEVKYQNRLAKASNDIKEQESLISELNNRHRVLFAEQMLLSTNSHRLQLEIDNESAQRDKTVEAFKNFKEAITHQIENLNLKIDEQKKIRNEQKEELEDIFKVIQTDPDRHLTINESTQKRLYDLLGWDETKRKEWNDIFASERSYSQTLWWLVDIVVQKTYPTGAETYKEMFLNSIENRISSLRDMVFNETEVQPLRQREAQLKTRLERAEELYKTKLANSNLRIVQKTEQKKATLHEIGKIQTTLNKLAKYSDSLDESLKKNQLNQLESHIRKIQTDIDIFQKRFATENVIPGTSDKNKIVDQDQWKKWLSEEDNILTYKQNLQNFEQEFAVKDKELTDKLFTIEIDLRKIRNLPSEIRSEIREQLQELHGTLTDMHHNFSARFNLVTQSIKQGEIIKQENAEKSRQNQHLVDCKKLYNSYFVGQPDKPALTQKYLQQRESKYAVKDYFESILALAFGKWGYISESQKRREFLTNEDPNSLKTLFDRYAQTGAQDDLKLLQEKLEEGIKLFPARGSAGDPNYRYSMSYLLNEMNNDLNNENLNFHMSGVKDEMESEPKPSFFDQANSFKPKS